MVRDWIMDSGSDSFCLQKFSELAPFLSPNYVHVVNVSRPRSFRRNLNHAFQSVVVVRRDFPTVIVQLVGVAQLNATDRSLDFVKAKIVADKIVDVFRASAVVA